MFASGMGRNRNEQGTGFESRQDIHSHILIRTEKENIPCTGDVVGER